MDFQLIIDSIPILLQGAWITVSVTVLSMALGLVLGMVAALGKLSNMAVVRWLATQYIDIIRGTPLLVQLFLIYYGLPQFGITIEPFPSAVLGLGINTGAYVAEVIRSGIQAVDKGQREAASALGLSPAQTMRLIILPQAFKIIIPPLGNQFIMLIKDSSLVSTITLVELTRTAQRIISTTYKPIELYIAAAAMYYIISLLATKLLNKLERKVRASE
ncbi:MAG: ectoine/hydroxyectoine ABC transporter permease subunit EhuC [Clostridia bacterium]